MPEIIFPQFHRVSMSQHEVCFVGGNLSIGRFSGDDLQNRLSARCQHFQNPKTPRPQQGTANGRGKGFILIGRLANSQAKQPNVCSGTMPSN